MRSKAFLMVASIACLLCTSWSASLWADEKTGEEAARSTNKATDQRAFIRRDTMEDFVTLVGDLRRGRGSEGFQGFLPDGKLLIRGGDPAGLTIFQQPDDRDLPLLIPYVVGPQRQPLSISPFVRMRGANAEPFLREALLDKNKEVRCAAARGLRGIATTASVAPLTQALGDRYWAMRWFAADALGETSIAQAIEPLRTAVRNESNLAVKVSMAHALWKLGDKSQLTGVITEGLRNRDATTRNVALAAASELDKGEISRDLIPQLQETLKEKDPSARCMGAQILVTLGENQGIDELVRLVLNKDEGVSESASIPLIAYGIQSLSNAEAVVGKLFEAMRGAKTEASGGRRLLESLALRDPKADTRHRIFQVVTVVAKSAAAKDGAAPVVAKWVEPLKEMVKDKSWQVRAQAAYTLHCLGDDSAVGVLKEILKRTKPEVESDEDSIYLRPPGATIAARMLADTEPAMAADVLAALLGSKTKLQVMYHLFNKEVAAPAADALFDIAGPARLISALSDKQTTIRMVAAWALDRESLDDTAIATLIERLADKDWGVRAYAARALGRVRAQKAASALDTLLVNDTEKMVRLHAAWALGRLGSQSSVQPLIQGLTKDESDAVRAYIAWALGELGDATAIPALEEATKGKDYLVQGNATYALQRLRTAQR